jgi:small-conductance mechanosensitive channel
MIDSALAHEIVRAAGILLTAGILAWLVSFAARVVKRRIIAQKPESNVPLTIDSAIRPLVIIIVIEGIILALMSFTYLEDWHPNLEKASVAAVVIVATYGFARTIGAIFSWQVLRIKESSRKPIDLSVAAFARTAIQAGIYVIGLLLLLDYLGIPISPLIASLGIGGLAVALALQPTIGNFFAGTQVITDRVARVGDFIELNEQTRGYVTEVGWRSTKIRTPYNNLVVIPNSILADSQVTNYNLPGTPVAIYVTCGVSYDSDLTRVKTVALEVANQVVQRQDEAVKKFEPWVGFESFGDSNVIFGVFIQAVDRLSSFNLKSELILNLHERFRKENITINYPVRMTYLNWPENVKAMLKAVGEKREKS